MMSDDRTTEYVTAFVVGALVGIGAALLLAPDPPTRREKLMKELKPYRKTLGKKTARMRQQVGRQVDAAGDWGEEVRAAGQAVVADLREEVAELVADARDQIAKAVENQVDSAHAGVRRGAKRIRS